MRKTETLFNNGTKNILLHKNTQRISLYNTGQIEINFVKNGKASIFQPKWVKSLGDCYMDVFSPLVNIPYRVPAVNKNIDVKNIGTLVLIVDHPIQIIFLNNKGLVRINTGNNEADDMMKYAMRNKIHTNPSQHNNGKTHHSIKDLLHKLF